MNHALKGLAIGLVSFGIIGGTNYIMHNTNVNASIINYIPKNKWVSEVTYSDYGYNNSDNPKKYYFMKYRNFRHLPKNLYSFGKRDGHDLKKYNYSLKHAKQSDDDGITLSDTMPNYIGPIDIIISTLAKSNLNKHYLKGLMSNKYNHSDKRNIKNFIKVAKRALHKSNKKHRIKRVIKHHHKNKFKHYNRKKLTRNNRKHRGYKKEL